MKFLKNISNSFLYILISILILTFITTIFNYFEIFSYKTINILEIIIIIIAMFLGGYKLGQKSNKKGYIEGIKLGIIFSMFLVIFNYLAFDNPFKIKYLLFYIILIASSSLGSMIGINKKNNQNK